MGILISNYNIIFGKIIKRMFRKGLSSIGNLDIQVGQERRVIKGCSSERGHNMENSKGQIQRS